MGLVREVGSEWKDNVVYRSFASAICCYDPTCQCSKTPEVVQNFSRDSANLFAIIRSRELSSDDFVLLFSQGDYVRLLILSYLQQLYDGRIDALQLSQRFLEYGIFGLSWLAKALDSRESRQLAVQTLEWLLFYTRKLISELAGFPLTNSPYSQEILIVRKTLNVHLSNLRDQLLDSLARDLVEGAAVGADRVKQMLDTYFTVIDAEVEIYSFKEIVKGAYSRMQTELLGRFLDAGPCEAQVMANLGTGFISHRPSYDFSHRHVELARLFFEESLSLLPPRVCRKQQNHLKQNIAIAKLVPEILRLIQGGNECEAVIFCNFDSWNRNQKHEWGSALRFVLMMLSDVNEPSRLDVMVHSLRRIASRIGHLYPDLAEKCLDFATTAPLNAASLSPASSPSDYPSASGCMLSHPQGQSEFMASTY